MWIWRFSVSMQVCLYFSGFFLALMQLTWFCCCLFYYCGSPWQFNFPSLPQQRLSTGSLWKHVRQVWIAKLSITVQLRCSFTYSSDSNFGLLSFISSLFANSFEVISIYLQNVSVCFQDDHCAAQQVSICTSSFSKVKILTSCILFWNFKFWPIVHQWFWKWRCKNLDFSWSGNWRETIGQESKLFGLNRFQKSIVTNSFGRFSNIYSFICKS
jgi:hypothetical protein